MIPSEVDAFLSELEIAFILMECFTKTGVIGLSIEFVVNTFSLFERSHCSKELMCSCIYIRARLLFLVLSLAWKWLCRLRTARCVCQGGRDGNVIQKSIKG